MPSLCGPFDTEKQCIMEAIVQRSYDSPGFDSDKYDAIFVQWKGKWYSYWGPISKPCRTMKELDKMLKIVEIDGEKRDRAEYERLKKKYEGSI